MRTVAVALVVLATVVAAVPRRPIGKEADQVQLTRQGDILRLLTHFHQPLLWEDLVTIARDYKIEPENYKVPQVVEDFLQLEGSGELLGRHQPISVFDDRQVDQIKIFFDLLYYAKDYDTFYKTALYLRDRVNKGHFMVSLIMAVLIRQDTQDIVLPPLYEVQPLLFFTSDVIQRVYDARLQGYAAPGEKPHYIPANYTGYPTAHTPEQTLSYFTEDVALNEFYAYFHHRHPYFLSAANYSLINGDIRGDVFYHTMRQVFARYNLERFANGLPEVAPIDYDKRIQSGYYPQLRLQNGIEIPVRPAHLRLRDANVFALERIRNSEYRISEAIDLGLVISEKEGRMRYKQEEATNIFGNLVQSTADSLHPRYYGALYKDLLSLFAKNFDSTQRYGISASVLGKYMTLLRDPVYFQVVRRILNIFQQYQSYLPPYTRENLEFPGLRIESVDVERLVTFFENFDIEVDNVLKVSSAEESEKLKIFARQPRLNHKPFVYRIKVSSEKPVKAIFRVFLGPRFDSYGNDIPLDVARENFVEFDRFVYQVQAGENEITRSSRDSLVLRSDPLSTRELFAAVRDGLEGKRSFWPAGMQRYGFPERLLLPRGSREGLPLRFYVIASPVSDDAPAASVDPQAPIGREWFTALRDGRAVGFPFDRRIPHSYNFRVPNSYLKDVVVYHKTIDEINRPTV